jgi:hypothetical protein
MDVRGAVAQVIAVLDPQGVPEAVLHTRAVGDFVQAHATETDGPVRVLTRDAVRRGLRDLVRSSVVEFDRSCVHREIRTTPRAQHDLLDALPPAQVASVIRTAADALMEIRPSVQSAEELWWSWRANARCLAARRPGVLWNPAGHDVLFALGASLAHENTPDAPVYWHRLLRDATEYLAPDHPQRLAMGVPRQSLRP